MEGMEAPQTPQPSRNFKVGDLVHVYNGTCLGTRGYKTIAYMGAVVGYDEHQSKWLVCAVIVLHCYLNLPDATFRSDCRLSRFATACWQRKGNPTARKKRSCRGI